MFSTLFDTPEGIKHMYIDNDDMCHKCSNAFEL